MYIPTAPCASKLQTYWMPSSAIYCWLHLRRTGRLLWPVSYLPDPESGKNDRCVYFFYLMRRVILRTVGPSFSFLLHISHIVYMTLFDEKLPIWTVRTHQQLFKSQPLCLYIYIFFASVIFLSISILFFLDKRYKILLPSISILLPDILYIKKRFFSFFFTFQSTITFFVSHMWSRLTTL